MSERLVFEHEQKEWSECEQFAEMSMVDLQLKTVDEEVISTENLAFAEPAAIFMCSKMKNMLYS